MILEGLLLLVIIVGLGMFASKMFYALTHSRQEERAALLWSVREYPQGQFYVIELTRGQQIMRDSDWVIQNDAEDFEYRIEEIRNEADMKAVALNRPLLRRHN